MVDSGLIVRLMTGHGLCWSLLADQSAVLVGRVGSIRRAGAHLALGHAGDKAGIDRGEHSSRTKASSTSDSKKRHVDRQVTCVVVAKAEAGWCEEVNRRVQVTAHPNWV